MKIAEGSKFLYERRQISSVQAGGVFPVIPSWRGSDLIGILNPDQGGGGVVGGGVGGGSGGISSSSHHHHHSHHSHHPHHPHPGMANLAAQGPPHPTPRSMTGKGTYLQKCMFFAPF